MRTDRRTLIGLAAGALAASALPKGAGAMDGKKHRRIVINALGGLGDPNEPPEGQDASNPTPGQPHRLFSERVLREAHASGLTAVNVTLGYVAGEADPYETTVRDIATWDWIVRQQSADLAPVLTAADIERAARDGRIGIIYGFQNAAMMGKDAGRVDTFADLGVRVVQLTYNPANELGGGAMAPAGMGLTPFGREVIERLNARRVMVDLSHSGEAICLDAARASRQPISINHTGCRALVDLPRNKTDAELRLVAEKGGFVGIYFMPFLDASGHATAEDVVAHIEHALNICGEDHVGIGTDGTVTAIDDLDAYKARLAAEVAARKASGIGAAGERADTYPFVPDLRGVDQFRKLAALLRARGHSAARIDKVLGLNFLRYAREVWGA